MVREASKEDALALLRERGGLLMQAATLSKAEEVLLAAGGRELVPWQQRQEQQQGGGTRAMMAINWLDTLGFIAVQVGEFSGNAHMWSHLLSGVCATFRKCPYGDLLAYDAPQGRVCVVF